MFGEDADREKFFESALLQAQQEFESDTSNAQALVRWGGALLELAHYKQGSESVDMIQLAIAKLEKALEIDPDRADADWCLGNAYTSLGFLCSEKPMAMQQFGKAANCFKRCNTKDPGSDTYKKAIEMCDKAPEYYDEIQSHIQAQSVAAEQQSKQPPASPNEIWWDIGGWALLAGAIAAALIIAKATSKPAA